MGSLLYAIFLNSFKCWEELGAAKLEIEEVEPARLNELLETASLNGTVNHTCSQVMYFKLIILKWIGHNMNIGITQLQGILSE